MENESCKLKWMATGFMMSVLNHSKHTNVHKPDIFLGMSLFYVRIVQKTSVQMFCSCLWWASCVQSHAKSCHTDESAS